MNLVCKMSPNYGFRSRRSSMCEVSSKTSLVKDTLFYWIILTGGGAHHLASRVNTLTNTIDRPSLWSHLFHFQAIEKMGKRSQLYTRKWLWPSVDGRAAHG